MMEQKSNIISGGGGGGVDGDNANTDALSAGNDNPDNDSEDASDNDPYNGEGDDAYDAYGPGGCVVGVCLTGALRAMASVSVQDAFLTAMDQLAMPWPPPPPSSTKLASSSVPSSTPGGGNGGNRGGRSGGGKGGRGRRFGRGRRRGGRGGWQERGCAVKILAHVSSAGAENKDQAVEASALQINRWMDG